MPRLLSSDYPALSRVTPEKFEAYSILLSIEGASSTCEAVRLFSTTASWRAEIAMVDDAQACAKVAASPGKHLLSPFVRGTFPQFVTLTEVQP